jgi:hypothetical protein
MECQHEIGQCYKIDICIENSGESVTLQKDQPYRGQRDEMGMWTGACKRPHPVAMPLLIQFAAQAKGSDIETVFCSGSDS